MALRVTTGEQGFAQSPQPVMADGDVAVVPDAQLLFTAEYSRLGDDLLLTGGDGARQIVTGYFASDSPPVLASPAGAVLTPDVVAQLAGPRAPGQYAQLGTGEGSVPIGQVEAVSGSVQVIRAGLPAGLEPGDPVFQNDVVQTGLASDLVIGFADGTVFSLSANARMVLDGMIYDPAGSSNSLSLSVVHGVFSFVTGLIAPTGGIDVKTPVATLGIRGTTVHGILESIAGPLTVFLGQSQLGSAARVVLADPLTGVPIGSLDNLGMAYSLGGVGTRPLLRPLTGSEQVFGVQRAEVVHGVQSAFEFRYGTGDPIVQPGETLRTQAGPNLPSGGIGFDREVGDDGAPGDGSLGGLDSSGTLELLETAPLSRLASSRASDFFSLPAAETVVASVDAAAAAPVGDPGPSAPLVARINLDETPGLAGANDLDPALTVKPAALGAVLSGLFDGAPPLELGLARSSFGLAFGAAGPGTVALNQVAAGPGAVALNHVPVGTPSGLFDTRTGDPILLFDGPNGTIVGRIGAADGPIAFVAFLGLAGAPSGLNNVSTANLWFVQYRAIAHDNPSDPDETGPEGGGLGATPPVMEVINFEDLAPGTYDGTDGAIDGTFEVFASGGSGPITITGFNPNLPGQNTAVIFDTADPPFGLETFGTPNQDFGGPGIDNDGPDTGGEAGSPFKNDTALGNMLIVANGLTDGDADGLLDDPRVVGGVTGIKQVYDFSAIGPVTIESITILDVDQNEIPARVDMFDASGHLIASFLLPRVGDNGVANIALGDVSSVFRMEVVLNGSGAIDNIAFTREGVFVDEVLTLGYTVRDAAGGTASGTAAIAIEDDGPTAADDPAVYLTAGESTGGDVLVNDTFGVDGPAASGDVTSFTFIGNDGFGNVIELTVGAGATVTTFAGGELTVHDDGTWTYVAPATISAATRTALGLDADPAGFVDDFSYTILDGDGDRDSATQPIRVTLDPSPPQVPDGTGMVLDGTAASDFLIGGNGADTLNGLGDGDFLFGGGGGDMLDGGEGNDLLFGDGGADTLDGGPGGDRLTGGEGADLFVLRPGGGGRTLAEADLIMDFQDGLDHLGLDGVASADLVISSDGAGGSVISSSIGGEFLAVIVGIDPPDITTDDFLDVI